MTYYILGFTNKYGHIEYNFDDVRYEHKGFHNYLIGREYIFEYEDEARFYFFFKGNRGAIDAVIQKIDVPSNESDEQLKGLLDFHDTLTDVLDIEAGDTNAVIQKVDKLVKLHG